MSMLNSREDGDDDEQVDPLDPHGAPRDAGGQVVGERQDEDDARCRGSRSWRADDEDGGRDDEDTGVPASEPGPRPR